MIVEGSDHFALLKSRIKNWASTSEIGTIREGLSAYLIGEIELLITTDRG